MKTIILNNILLICLLTFTHWSSAQELGLSFDENAYNATKSVKYKYGSKSDDDVPFKASVNKIPDISNQGAEGRCVGEACGYYALTIMHAEEKDWVGSRITEEAFSARYPFNHAKLMDCGNGTTFPRLLSFLQNTGNVKMKDFDPENCHDTGVEELKNKAQYYKIKGYFKVFDSNDHKGNKIFKVKKHIANGYPVVVGLQLRFNFRRPTEEFWKPTEGDTRYWGGHAMTVVSYSDYKKAFKLVNSWGSDWGQDGFIWVRYDDFAEFCPEAYRIILDEEVKPEPEDVEEERQLVNYRGAFEFRTPVFNDDETITYKVITPKKDSEYLYTLDQKWSVGDMYQLVVTKTQTNRATYVFSVDGEGTNIHFPKIKKEDINASNYTSTETPLIPFKNVRIVVPGDDRALTKRIEGDDNIVVLYAYEGIEDFEDRVAKVNNAEGSIEERIKVGFGDLLIDESEINYEENGMEFYSQTKSTKSVVPMILRVEE